MTREIGGDSSHVPFFFSCRFMLAVVGFFVFMHLYAQRIGMSVAIVCMLNQTALDDLESLQTVSASKLVPYQPNETEWSMNSTVDSSANSRCIDQLDGGSVVHKVESCFFLFMISFFIYFGGIDKYDMMWSWCR